MFMLASFFPTPKIVLPQAAYLRPMNRTLTSALLASFSLHVGMIILTPAGGGFALGKAAHVSSSQVALRLPARIEKNEIRPLAEQERTQDRAPPPHVTTEDEPAGMAEPSDAVGFGLPLPDAPRYYDSKELTERPAALDTLPPDLEETLPAGNTGRAILMLEIDAQGLVLGITSETSDLAPTGLTRLTEAFRGMRFRPGHIGKTPVNSRMRIEVTIDDLRGGLGERSR